MIHYLSQDPRRRLNKGFSLAEVTIALAIAAGGFVSLLGLLPQGLEMSRRTAEMAAETRIIDRISGELMSTPWSELSWSGYGTEESARRYFDDQGIEIDMTSPNAKLTLSYVASIYLPPSSSDDMDVKLPSTETSAQEGQRYLRKVIVAVAATVNDDYSFPDPEQNPPPRFVKFHSVVIPEMGIPLE